MYNILQVAAVDAVAAGYRLNCGRTALSNDSTVVELWKMILCLAEGLNNLNHYGSGVLR